MNTETNEDDPNFSKPAESVKASTTADASSDAEEKPATPPEQPPGGENALHDPDAPDEAVQAEEGALGEVESQKAVDEMKVPPDALTAVEADGEVKLEFRVETKDPPGTAKRVIELLAQHYAVFQRGGTIVSLFASDQDCRVVMKELSASDVASLFHEVWQPYVVKKTRSGTSREEVALPEGVVKHCWSTTSLGKLPVLNGIAYAPLLAPDGTIRCIEGYDPATGLYCVNTATVTLPDRPERSDAEAALRRLRKRIRTFPFEDSVRVKPDGYQQSVVDIEQRPGANESIFLTALLTAVCRPNLPLVPGLLITAPYLSGAGTGKGMLVRFVSEGGYGMSPTAMPTGHNAEEFDKRLTAALMMATPIIMLDNVNATELRSNLLASAITENPAQVRRMGTSTLVSLNPAAFICVTGNGLSVTEDLRRRFLEVQLNPGMENPEARSFEGNFLAETKRDRREILSDALIIVTWALQQGDDLPRGRPLGSFEQWGRMCRDPLLALNCKDAVEEMAERHVTNAERSELSELFEVWWRFHGDREMIGKDLHPDVWNLLAPFGEPRQRVARKLILLSGTVCNGFRLRQIKMPGNWSAYRYRLERLNPALDPQGHPPEDGQPRRR
jgi:hypothetical protein